MPISKVPREDMTFDSPLVRCKLFEDLPRAALEEIATITTKVYAYPGQTIIEEGEQGEDVFVLVSGRVKIQIESITPYVEIGITKLGVGEIIGEMALLGPAPRSATVVALESSEFLRLPADELRQLADRRSDWGVILMRNLADVLAGRLRSMNRRMLNYVRARYY